MAILGQENAISKSIISLPYGCWAFQAKPKLLNVKQEFVFFLFLVHLTPMKWAKGNNINYFRLIYCHCHWQCQASSFGTVLYIQGIFNAANIKLLTHSSNAYLHAKPKFLNVKEEFIFLLFLVYLWSVENNQEFFLINQQPITGKLLGTVLYFQGNSRL